MEGMEDMERFTAAPFFGEGGRERGEGRLLPEKTLHILHKQQTLLTVTARIFG